MSYIIAARFEIWDKAGEAAERLMREGFSEDAIHTFYVNPAGAHAQFPTGGDRLADPDATGGSAGAWGGGALLGVIGAVVGVIVGSLARGNIYVLIVATGVGAYLGSLIGAMGLIGRGRKKNGFGRSMAGALPGSQASQTADDSDPAYEHPAIRHAGVTLAVVADPSQRDFVTGILREMGGVDVERAVGRWENGKWADFDPIKPPELVDNARATSAPVQPPPSPNPSPEIIESRFKE
jgi:hypothetical protein